MMGSVSWFPFDNIPARSSDTGGKETAKDQWMVLYIERVAESASARGGRPVGPA